MGYSVKLDVFEGPLDLLLYFIKRDEINIYDIPISRITDEYLEYLQLMKDMNLQIAGEFILMAALLIRIKLQMLLAPDGEDGEEEIEIEDPRTELVQMLEEYQKYKKAGEYLKLLEEENLKYHPVNVEKPAVDTDVDLFLSDISLYELAVLFKNFIQKTPKSKLYEIEAARFTIDQRIQQLRSFFIRRKKVKFNELELDKKNRLEIIVTFLAILEMVKNGELGIHQERNFDDIALEYKNGVEIETVANT